MTASRIQTVALARFAAQGFAATSMAEIAGDVGIKKPSLYAHFAGKRALFLSLLELTVREEHEYTARHFSRVLTLEEALYSYLLATVERFSVSPHLRFWLNTLYFPPADLLDEIRAWEKIYGEGLEGAVNVALCQSGRAFKLPCARLGIGYIGLLRGLHAKLLYSDEADSLEMLDVMWELFLLALQKPE